MMNARMFLLNSMVLAALIASAVLLQRMKNDQAISVGTPVASGIQQNGTPAATEAPTSATEAIPPQTGEPTAAMPPAPLPTKPAIQGIPGEDDAFDDD